jgi:Gas vesicle synthesis protein GvpL/GvpF
MAKSASGTYVFCLVAGARRPSVARAPRAHAGMGRIRLVDVDRRLWLAVADAPLDRYGEDAINRGLSDLEWVSRAAVAHEAVVESFAGASAVVPMKLFTIFMSDARALEYIARERPRVDAVLKRVAHHLEWGVRVVPDRPRSAAAARPPARPGAGGSGAGSGAAFLTRKKAQRDAAVELGGRAREVVADLYDRLAAHARAATRRAPGERPVQGGPLLLDAAFLVSRSRSARFEKLATRAARDLERRGYRVTLSGPWPPYSFIEE